MATVDQLLASLSATEAALATVAGRHALILRSPYPGEIQVAPGAHVALRVVDLDGDPADATYPGMTVRVSIDSGSGYVLAYDDGAGGFQAGWAGAGSVVTTHALTDPYCYQHITIDQDPGVFPDDTTISVRVEITAPGTLDETYTWDTIDTVAPRLLSAEAVGVDQVLLTFDDAMTQTTADGQAETSSTAPGPWNLAAGGETLLVRVDRGAEQTVVFATDMWLVPAAVTPTEVAAALSALVAGATAEEAPGGVGDVILRSDTVGDASYIQVTGGTANAILGWPTGEFRGQEVGVLEHSNYAFTRLNEFPAVAASLSAVGAAAQGTAGTQVLVTTQWEMTRGAPYRVTVAADVTDTGENPIDPDHAAAEFAGFEPPWPARRDTSLSLPDDLWIQDTRQHLRALVNGMEEVLDWCWYDGDRLPEQQDPDLAAEWQLDLHLADLGNPFANYDLDMSLALKKKLVDMLPFLYKWRGTDLGIETAVYLLLGITVNVAPHMAECWVLGEDLLGDYYPAQVLCANVETYNLAAGPTDLWIAVDGGRTITAVDQATPSFTVAGLRAAEFPAGAVFQVVGSTGNDGQYTVAPAGPTETGGETVVPVTAAIPSATADGVVAQVIQFSNVAGVDFAAPAAATAAEVATAIAAQIVDGGAGAVDPGGGPVVSVISASPTGSIQVHGGTANAALGFDTAIHSATGGCVLGPTPERQLRTFDIVVSGALPSTEDTALIRRIAEWGKPVNTHLGTIRTAYVVADDGIWRLGASYLGADTVLG